MDWHPDHRTCRRFGVISLVMCVLLAALLGWWRDLPPGWAIVIAAFGTVVFVLSLIGDAFVRPVYVGLTLVTLPIGWVLSYVVLGVVYFLVLTPIGLVSRLFGYDPLRLRRDPDAESYWTPHEPPGDVKRYFNQF
jgi:hypothetical protein